MMKSVCMVKVYGTQQYVKVSKEAFNEICDWWSKYMNGFKISDDYTIYTDQDFGVYSEDQLLGFCYFVEEG